MSLTSPMLAIALAHLAIVVTPGPNFLIITRNALTHNRQVGLFTMSGVIVGNLFYIFAGFLGFTAIISQSAWLFTTLKIIGAGYLLYLGVKSYWSTSMLPAESSEGETANTNTTSVAAFRSGILTTLSNPKAAFYFVVLFTTLVSPAALFAEKALIFLIIVAISVGWYTVVAILFSNKRISRLYRKAADILNRILGGLWIFFGVKLLTTEP